jgi:hypothetical protein
MNDKPLDVSRMTFPEIFQHISDLTPAKRKEAIPHLCELVPDLKILLKLVFNKSWNFSLPKGNPPFEPLNIPRNFGYMRLSKEIRKFRYFFAEYSPQIKQAKREQLFIQMLESLSAEEADLILQVKDKKLKYKGFTRKLMENTIPDIFEGEELGKSHG